MAAWLAQRTPQWRDCVTTHPCFVVHGPAWVRKRGWTRLQASACLQALEVVSALLDPLPVPSEAANSPDSPASVTELHASVRSATVQVGAPTPDGLPEDKGCRATQMKRRLFLM